MYVNVCVCVWGGGVCGYVCAHIGIHVVDIDNCGVDTTLRSCRLDTAVDSCGMDTTVHNCGVDITADSCCYVYPDWQTAMKYPIAE